MEQQLAFLPVKIFIVKNSGQCLSAYLYKSYWIIEYLLLHLSLISQICKEHIISLYIVSGLIWQYSIGKKTGCRSPPPCSSIWKLTKDKEEIVTTLRVVF